MKLHIGTGPNWIEGEGWWNARDESELDIRKPLPFANDSIDIILLEHVIEHVSFADGWKFLGEAFRVLRPSGGIRLSFPDATRLHLEDTAWRYAALITDDETASRRQGYRAIFEDWGHLAAYTRPLMFRMLEARGFVTMPNDAAFGRSGLNLTPKEIAQLDQFMGRSEAAMLETSIVEGLKP